MRLLSIYAIVFTAVVTSCASNTQDQPTLSTTTSKPFYSSVVTPKGLCDGINGPTVSHAGHIGLKGDTPAKPKRSFFWYFEAEKDARNAPIILTMAGGPGSSGMLNALLYQAPCILNANGTVPNENRWSEKFNLLALDHPIGVGYSYGTRVNSSQAAALDVYDFLQKFFTIFPYLSKNKLILSDGSYGGVYLAHIGTVIHEGNLALKQGKGNSGDIHLNLESIMLDNPFADPVSHFTWLLQYRCVLHQVYNSTTCEESYPILPSCLESIQLAYSIPSVENRVASADICLGQLSAGSTNGILLEDIRRRCDSDDVLVCYPEYGWAENFFNGNRTKQILKIPDGVDFIGLGSLVGSEFYDAGDLIQPHQSLYGPLLAAGIRLLHYIGAQDANCPWLGISSSLKLLKSPYQQRYLAAEDVAWPSANATIRKVGDGAGDMTYILLQEAGHTVGQDQPLWGKFIIEHWIDNVPFI